MYKRVGHIDKDK